VTWIWVAIVVGGIAVAATYALCVVAAAGDADYRRAVEQPAAPRAAAADSVARLAPSLERLVALSAEMLGADLAAVALETGVWCCRAAERRVVRRPPGTEPSALVAGAQAGASVPIGDDNAVRGRLTVISNEHGRHFSGRELVLLGTLADACAAALAHPTGADVAAIAAQVDALAVTLGPARAELRWRGGDFVAFVAAVGHRVRLREDEQAELELAARLLDLGMLRVPRAMVERHGPLRESERRLVRRHASWGAEALLLVPGLAAVAMLLLGHHERWDGTGYPHGLAAERIPLAARVLAGCDAWWAMTSRRPFARPLGAEEAIDQLVAASGGQLDPEVVQALLAEVAGVTLVA
jgi:hypothetical protein